MEHAVIRTQIFSASLLGCSLLTAAVPGTCAQSSVISPPLQAEQSLRLAAGPSSGGTERPPPEESYDWQGTWESSYKKEVPGRSFPWEFTRVKDTFWASIYFSVDARGHVRGWAHGSIVYRFEYDGCSNVERNTCVTRCKGFAALGTDKWTFEGPVDFQTRFFPGPGESATPVTGQVNGNTVHLKLGPPVDPVPFEVKSTCVGARGTKTTSTKMSWFCAAGSHVCAASAMFLEIDMPLAHEAAQPIHTTEAGGGLDGMVRIRRSCRNIHDGERGFVYVSANSTSLHSEPMANSPNVGGLPRGAKILFTDTLQKDGARWYYLAPPGGNAGWVRSSDVSCERPPSLPAGKPLKLEDTGLGTGHPSWCNCSAGNG